MYGNMNYESPTLQSHWSYLTQVNGVNITKTQCSLYRAANVHQCNNANRRSLTFTEPTFAYAKAHKKSPSEIHLVHLGNKEIYCTVKTWCISSVLYSTNYHLLKNSTFLCSNNTHICHKTCTKI